MILINMEETRPTEIKGAVEAKIRIMVMDQSPHEAMGMALAAVDDLSAKLIAGHPGTCPGCLPFRQAKLIRYHLAQIEDEMKTEMGKDLLDGQQENL